jgi:hypothetical protein
MNQAQKAFQKLKESVGVIGFYLNPTEIKSIEDKLVDAPVQAPKVFKKAPAKKSGKK